MWGQIGSIFMFFGVALGAFGAHALKDKLTGHYIDVYKTAVLYHFVHSLALFVVAWLSTTVDSSKVNYAGISFVIGILLFSGSLYILSVTQIKWIGAITPLGGLSFLTGWVFLLLAFGIKG